MKKTDKFAEKVDENGQKMNTQFNNLEEILRSYSQEVINSKNNYKVLPLHEALFSRRPDFHNPITRTAFIRLSEMFKNLGNAVEQDRRYPSNEALLLRTGSGAMGFYPHFVGQPLLKVAVESGNVDRALDWLNRVLSTPRAKLIVIQALWGVPVQTAGDLTDKVKIVPFGSLPDSRQKVGLNGNPMSMGFVTNLSLEPPSSALVTELELAPLLLSNGQTVGTEEFRSLHELFIDIGLVLTVIGPRVPTFSLQWSQFDDPDIELARIGASSLSQHIEILPRYGVEYPELEIPKAAETIKQFLDLTTSLKKKIRIALQRLQQSQKRVSVGDRAVELATGFETLLGDNAKNEMTHKIKVRSVRFLGGSPEERKTHASVMSWMYDTRSQLVHTGEFSGKAKKIGSVTYSPAELIEQTTDICVKVIQKILHRKAIPEWSSFDILEQCEDTSAHN